MKPLTQEWVAKAEGDFVVAAQIMRGRKHRVFDAVCIHSQQAAEKYFIGNAQILRKIQALETSLKDNSKIVVPAGSDLVNVLGDMAGIIPIRDKPDTKYAPV